MFSHIAPLSIRAKRKKKSFYQPKGLVLQMQATLQSQMKGKP